MLRSASLGVTLTLIFVRVHTLPLHGSRGTDSVTASGTLFCGGLPAKRVTVRRASADSQGNRTTLAEVVPHENGVFAINGTEKEIAMPDFWLEIMHYCTKTRPVVERMYERYIDPFYYYNSKDTRTPRIYSVRRLDLLPDL